MVLDTIKLSLTTGIVIFAIGYTLTYYSEYVWKINSMHVFCISLLGLLLILCGAIAS
jgi:hypothetical protein